MLKKIIAVLCIASSVAFAAELPNQDEMKKLVTSDDVATFSGKVVIYESSHGYYGYKSMNFLVNHVLMAGYVDKYLHGWENGKGHCLHRVINPDATPSNCALNTACIKEYGPISMRLATKKECAAILAAVDSHEAKFDYQSCSSFFDNEIRPALERCEQNLKSAL